MNKMSVFRNQAAVAKNVLQCVWTFNNAGRMHWKHRNVNLTMLKNDKECWKNLNEWFSSTCCHERMYSACIKMCQRTALNLMKMETVRDLGYKQRLSLHRTMIKAYIMHGFVGSKGKPVELRKRNKKRNKPQVYLPYFTMWKGLRMSFCLCKNRLHAYTDACTQYVLVSQKREESLPYDSMLRDSVAVNHRMGQKEKTRKTEEKKSNCICDW